MSGKTRSRAGASKTGREPSKSAAQLRGRVTIIIDADLKRRLLHSAIERGCDAGTIVAPLLERELQGSYWVDRSPAAPRLAATPPPAPESAVNGESA